MSADHGTTGPDGNRNVSLKVLEIGAVVFGFSVAGAWVFGCLDVTSGAGTVSLVLLVPTVLLFVLITRHQLRGSTRGLNSGLNDVYWSEVIRRLYAWLSLTFATLILLVVAFALAFAAASGDAIPTSVHVALGLAGAVFVSSLVPLFLQSPTELKVRGCLYALIAGILIIFAG